MKHLKTLLFVLVIAAVIFALARVAETFKASRLKATEDVASVEVAAWPARVGSVTRGSLQQTYATLGTLESIAEVQVAGQFPGTILELGPRAGERVEAGTLLARIDTQEFDANIAANQAELDAAQEESTRLDAELAREQELLAGGGSTQSKVDANRSMALAARKKVAAIQKGLEAMETKRGYATVTAPVSGVIKTRLAEVGDLCVAYHPLFTIDADGAARLTMRLPQSLIHSIDVGTKVRANYGTQVLSTTLTRIHPELTHLALITVDADLESLPFDLPSGARVETQVVLDKLDDATIVPLASLFGKEGDKRILRVQSKDDLDTVEVVAVEVRLQTDRMAAVVPLSKDALKAGMQVVTGRPERLAKVRPGDPIQVIGKEN